MENNYLLKKWDVLINACKSYYIDSIPTGMSDEEYDTLEFRAIKEDGFFVRDYVFNTYLKGKKTLNKWISKVKKTKVTEGTMLEALKNMQDNILKEGPIYCDLKYDGSSLAIYLDPNTGRPVRIVTVGNLNIDNYGVDQTWKLINFLPNKFPKGIVAIQAEALVDISRLPEGVDPDTVRQKANGLINSKYCEDEVNSLLTLRAYRYYLAEGNKFAKKLLKYDYREVLSMFDTVYSNLDGHILFSPASTWTIDELELIPGYTETGKTITPTGYFLNDGWVIYNKQGVCRGALKYSGAGKDTEAIKTTVRGIQWNSQSLKGKDSWSANIIIDPVTIKGCTVKKPSAGSVSKLVKNNITPGAEVSIILANSTIPMIGEVYSSGNGDFMWPTCSCGYHLSEKDIFGSNLKCGNKDCTERYERMFSYLKSLDDLKKMDLNKLLVIDRFKWEDTSVSIDTILSLVSINDLQGYLNYLRGFLKTDLQRKNFDLIGNNSFKVIRNFYEKYFGI